MSQRANRAWGVAVALAAVAAAAVKLRLAWRTSGTIDVVYWQQFLAVVREFGDARVYARHELFNHPPLLIHGLAAVGALTTWSGAPFAFWLRLPSVAADAASVALLWRLRPRLGAAAPHPATLLLLALAPATAMISGYHGNTDSLMIFFAVLGVSLAGRRGGAWTSGAALGAACSIKAPALLLLPVFVLQRRGLRERAALLLAAAAVALLLASPFVFQEPALIAARVLGYGGGATPWGLSLLARLLPPEVMACLPADSAVAAVAGLRAALAAGLVTLAWALNRGRRPPPLYHQCTLTLAAFLTLTPGFGVQYLAWLVPWVAAAGVATAALFHAASGWYLWHMYRLDYFGFPTPLAPSLACWGAVALVGLATWRGLSRR